jgi:hypothetical protein
MRNAVKRVTHKERAQPSSRKKFGLLEKHKVGRREEHTLQHTAYSIQHTAYSIHHTACSIQHTAYSMQA